MNQPVYCSSNHPLPLEPSSPNDAVFSYWKWRDQTNADVDDGGGTATTVTSWRACSDCGNRAKKECKFRRCRTCCRARAFPCSTHVRSTWVPVASRRKRPAVEISGVGDGSSGSSFSASKKPRFNDSQTTAASYSSTSISNNALNTFTHQDAILKQSLPSKVHAPAIFRRHRVTAISDGDGEVEVAYQVAVRICGHVFKGFLYDQGVDEKNGDYSSSSPIVVLSTPNPSSPS
ncbi:protein SHI RELATED SEQUENCE 6-like [Humulus lupulus]|uniref:protein SHI RELATED SEQUENCE 6-like n=1 Tax=Humulus lupulus TaxID=3486 RepID=UPI002B4096E6|nr:protein SHI RELATED SEQUENCE 6-like [Humulus lupulus]